MANTSTTELDLLKTVTTSGGATDTLNVVGTVTATPSGVQHVIVDSGTITLPVGAGTGAKQDTGNASLASIDTKTPSLGQATMSSSAPVTIASDQSGVYTKLTDTSLATFSASGASSTTFDLQGLATLSIQVNPVTSWSGSINFSGSVDGTNYSAITGADLYALDGQAYSEFDSATFGSGNAQRIFQLPIAGLKTLKLAWNITVNSVAVAVRGSMATNILSAIQTAGYVQQLGAWTTTTAGEVAQGSTTSGQSGELTQSATTTNAPTYTTAKTNPLSSDTSGNLRVSLKDSPANTNKFLVTADAVTFASPQHVIADSGTITTVSTVSTITNVVHVDDNSGSLTVDNNGTFAVQAAATLAAETTKVIGTVNIASSQTVGLATGANTIGALTANQSVNNAQVAGNAVSTGNGGVGTGVQRVAIASDNTAFSVNATPPTLTKGTQGSTGYSVQRLQDASRTHVNFYASGVASGSTGTETAITMTKSSGTSSTSSAASFVVTSGKTYRITSITFGTRGNATGTAEVSTFVIRINTGGGVTTSSTPVVLSARSGAAATALAYDRISIDLADGYEIAGDGTLQFGVTANSVFSTNAPTWDVLITGYEY